MRISKQFTPRKIFLFIAVICTLAVCYSFYAEFYMQQEPCPLCITQRIVFIVITVLALLYAMHNPVNWIIRIYGLVILGFALFNIKIAIHHLWLISLPPEQQPLSCGMPLSMLYERVPLQSFIHTILQGDAECSKITWTIMGLTPPTAVIILSTIIAILALKIALKPR